MVVYFSYMAHLISPDVQNRHPYQYTLELLRLAILHLPPSFPKEKRRGYEKKLDQFLDKPKTKYEDIQKVIVSLGYESWADRKAYEEMYSRYGHSSEEAFLLEHLDAGVREKYERFINEGGKLRYVATVKSEEQLRQPSPFERYFTPEEKFAIEQALIIALDYARKEINDLVVGAKRSEYAELVKQYDVTQEHIADKIEELRRLASVSKKWEPAISDRVRLLEEGWSVVEKGATLEEVTQEVEYWKGTLQTFLDRTMLQDATA